MAANPIEIPGEIELVRFKDPNEALGLAAHLLAKNAPLNEMPLGRVIPMMEAAIQRNHYLFAKRGGRVCGVLGWGFSDFAQAEAWIKGHELKGPINKDDGPCVLIFCLQADTSDVVRELTAAIRGPLFPRRHLAYYIRVKRRSDGSIQRKGVRFKRPRCRLIVAKAPLLSRHEADIRRISNVSDADGIAEHAGAGCDRVSGLVGE